MAKRKRSYFEIIVITVVVVLTVVLAAGLYAGRTKVQKSNLLVQELGMLRSSLLLYKTINNHSAPSLEQLMTEEYDVGTTKRTYVERLPFSKDGKIIDPFGNPYNYDPKTGWLSSTTSSYEKW
ncbi:MAG: hypothetical protein ABH871_08775 [Pseudomonadota bacterium]